MFFLMQDCNEEDRQSILDLYNLDNIANIKSPWDEKVDDTNLNEEEKEGSSSLPNDSSNLSGNKKLENKREKGKIRSKRARDRKKNYIEELELKVKELEMENLRLNRIIDQYKIQGWNKFKR